MGIEPHGVKPLTLSFLSGVCNFGRSGSGDPDGGHNALCSLVVVCFCFVPDDRVNVRKKNSPLHTRKGNSENGQMLLKMYPCIDRRRRRLGHALCFAMVDSEIKNSKIKKGLSDIKRNK